MNTKRLFHRALSQIRGASFAVQYWDDELVQYGAGPAAETCIIHLKEETVCKTLLKNLSTGFGEAYVSGTIDVHGDFQKLIQMAFIPASRGFGLTLPQKVTLALIGRCRPNSLRRARRNVAHHYDLGNDFFRLWLDKAMAYSNAYFRRPEDSIDAAQEQKFQHVCAKLLLRPGERVLDIGCGWGAFLIHAARSHDIRALGITLSEEQRRGAEERIAALGLRDRITIEVKDYRDVRERNGFDKVVSLGMFEHVGKRNIPEYFRHTADLLKDGGLGVLETIWRPVASASDPWISKYIFPGIYFPSLAEITEPLGESGLYMTDIEDLRVHYALTLEKWREAYEAHVEEVRTKYGEAFTRLWRLYLTCSAANFRSGNLCVAQIQFSKGVTDEISLTRDYLYR